MRLAKDVRAKVSKHVNAGFTDALHAAFKAKFGRELETGYNIFVMALVSQPADGADFTPEQAAFCQAFEIGYSAAMSRLESPSGVARP
jgi:hypothetical protein